MSTEGVQIQRQPVSVDDAAARQLVTRPRSPAKRLVHRLADPMPDSLTLSYKPFYVFDLILTVSQGRDDAERGGCIAVDAVTGIARARPDGYTEIERATVSSESLVARELTPEEGLEEAASFRRKVEVRERRESELENVASVVYKPVWVVRLKRGNRCVIDATTGELFSDLSLWKVLVSNIPLETGR